MVSRSVATGHRTRLTELAHISTMIKAYKKAYSSTTCFRAKPSAPSVMAKCKKEFINRTTTKVWKKVSKMDRDVKLNTLHTSNFELINANQSHTILFINGKHRPISFKTHPNFFH